MLQNVADSRRARMRAEGEIPVAELAPDGCHLVRLARVRVEHVLKRWITRSRNLLIRNGGERIFHRLHDHLSARAPMIRTSGSAERNIVCRIRSMRQNPLARPARARESPGCCRRDTPPR